MGALRNKKHTVLLLFVIKRTARVSAVCDDVTFMLPKESRRANPRSDGGD